MLVSFKTSKNPKEITQLKMLCLKKQKNRGVRISKKSVRDGIHAVFDKTTLVIAAQGDLNH